MILVVGAIVILGALLRFATMGAQSYWYDEAMTVQLVHGSFGAMLSGVHDGESTPPLYYALAWGWSHVFGYGEAGLRSLSALIGTLTIPVAYGVGRTLAGRLAGIITALLVAIAPPLIWYSQEARSYPLLVLLCGVSLLFFLRSQAEPTGRNLAGWAIGSALALATHYFAAFLVVPEVAVLLWRSRDRRTLLAVGTVAATAVALAPLALYQQHHGAANWITLQPLTTRLKAVATCFVTGTGWGGVRPLWALPILGVAAGAAYLFWRSDRETRRRVAVAGLVALAVLGIPVVLAGGGKDYVLDRNLLAGWLPLAAALAVVLAGGMRHHPRLAGLLLATLVVLFAGYDVRMRTDSRYQRDDWRAVAQVLGPAREQRVVVVAPAWQAVALGMHTPRMLGMGAPAKVREIDVVVYTGFVPATQRPKIPVPGKPFKLTALRQVQNMTIGTYHAPRRTLVRPGPLTTDAAARARTVPFLQYPG